MSSTKNSPDILPHTPPRYPLFLIMTAVTCGALVMIIEVLGSRVIGPFFGVSLFVWTSLITVTMVSLALGYAIGGWFSDRHSADHLYGIILAAGLLTLLIPWLDAPVLRSCVTLGLRFGALLSSTILFGPTLFLLGCVSPYVIKLATHQTERVGRTVGGFYALSTVGSVIGTVLTGFVLVSYLGVTKIFMLVGGTLIALALLYFVFMRKKWIAVLALALLAPVFLAGEARPTKMLLEDGTTVEVMLSRESQYGSLRVADYSYGPKHTRELLIDGLIQGGIDMQSRLSIYGYAYMLQFLPRGYHPNGQTCLVVGLGAGVVPTWYSSLGVRTDVVDIDPDIVSIAREYFDFSTSGDIYAQDARYFLGNTEKQYDYVILDVFAGDTTPGYILSTEALSLVRSRMTDEGVLGINIIGSLNKNNYMTASIVKTLESVFDQVAAYPLFDPSDSEASGNIILIAYQGDQRVHDRNIVFRHPVHPFAQERVFGKITRPYEFPPDTPAMILTDEYNPLDVRDVWVKEKLRRNILKGTEWDVLLDQG